MGMALDRGVANLSNRLSDDEVAEIRLNYTELNERFPLTAGEDDRIRQWAQELRSNFC